MILTIEPISVGENNKDILVPKTLTASDTYLADITMTWDSFFHRFSIKDLEPIVTINQSGITDFYFPELNGTIPQINFTVVCKHRLENPVLFPRFTVVYLAISYNGTYILLNQSINHRCKSLDWEYINLTVESNDQFIPLITNGENITLTAEVGAYSFFFGLHGTIETLDPIIIHPVPIRSK
jgi:hypothetical protein